MARTGRPRQFNREQAIKSAMDLFWQKGYESTSLAELRKVVGNISSASFYAAFGSKQALYSECLALYTSTCNETFSDLENETIPAKDAIKNMLLKNVHMQTSAKQPSGCMIVLSGLNCGDENKEVEQMALSVRNDIRKSLVKCIERGTARNEWRQEMPIEQFMLILDTFINGISIQSRDGIAREKLLEACELFLDRW
ncbi:TetR/AcrR family transcriptional regulator [uncultured Psychromonas sp.]|uniref:TetR/AcrR family transcriptional regulator n=1 Tax=uncultured Psychromonas sp. TaxID=173974 RepID=UPI002605990B|nr:TetR/AcrR family transcriptional regulator [uncultured Psychromonas sp.]